MFKSIVNWFRRDKSTSKASRSDAWQSIKTIFDEEKETRDAMYKAAEDYLEELEKESSRQEEEDKDTTG